MPPYKIIIADQQSLFRQGVKRIIEEVQSLKVIDETGDGLALVKLLRRLHPDMIILEVVLPNLGGIDVIAEAKRIRPDLKSIFLTAQHEYLQPAMAAGADGYLLKQDADVELIAAIKTVRNGSRYVSQLLSEHIAELMAAKRPNGRHESFTEVLSLRERQVLKLIAEGKLNREIADLFCISVRTVEHHRANIIRKLKTSRPADLVKYAMRKGYIE